MALQIQPHHRVNRTAQTSPFYAIILIWKPFFFSKKFKPSKIYDAAIISSHKKGIRATTTTTQARTATAKNKEKKKKTENRC